MKMSKVCAIFANGLEECEGLITVDLLRRAGVEVTIASVHDTLDIVSSHQIHMQADALAKDLNMEEYDMLFLPGGLGGTNNLKDSELVADACRQFAAREDKFLAAICAAPSVLGQLGLLKGRKATCFPGWEGQLEGADITGEAVTESGNIVTGKGMGVTIPFALALIARLISPEKADEIAAQIQYR